MFGLNAPSITLAQISAALVWLVGQLVAMGLLDEDTSRLVLQVATTVLTASWVIADAVIRQGRAKAAGIAAAAQVPTATISSGPTGPKSAA